MRWDFAVEKHIERFDSRLRAIAATNQSIFEVIYVAKKSNPHSVRQ